MRIVSSALGLVSGGQSEGVATIGHVSLLLYRSMTRKNEIAVKDSSHFGSKIVTNSSKICQTAAAKLVETPLVNASG
jgi:hypothetical protein